MVTRLTRKLVSLGDGLFPVLGSASAGVILISLTGSSTSPA